eukprot:scaffold10209_cov68-Phaeocystis_antarctica.AAC.3
MVDSISGISEAVETLQCRISLQHASRMTIHSRAGPTHAPPRQRAPRKPRSVTEQREVRLCPHIDKRRQVAVIVFVHQRGRVVECPVRSQLARYACVAAGGRAVAIGTGAINPAPAVRRLHKARVAALPCLRGLR